MNGKGKGVVYSDGEIHVDHEDGDFGLSLKETTKGLKQMAQEVHPDPNANANKIQELVHKKLKAEAAAAKSCYEILKGMEDASAAMKRYDHELVLRLQRCLPERKEKVRVPPRRFYNAERNRMYHVLLERVKSKEEEEKEKQEEEELLALEDKLRGEAKYLRVTWESTSANDNTAAGLREMFQEYGQVEDVIMRTTEKKSTAILVMSTNEPSLAAALAAAYATAKSRCA